jgi:lysophospholipase L1-like esterase
VVVFGGTNDYGHGDAPLGTAADETPATYMGAVRFLMKYLTTEFAGRPIVFMTPARRLGDEDVSRRHPINGTALPLVAYVDAIHTVAKDFDVTVIDLYRNLGIDPNREEDLKKYAPDGLHFNDAGHARIAALLEAHLRAL